MSNDKFIIRIDNWVPLYISNWYFDENDTFSIEVSSKKGAYVFSDDSEVPRDIKIHNEFTREYIKGFIEFTK